MSSEHHVHQQFQAIFGFLIVILLSSGVFLWKTVMSERKKKNNSFSIRLNKLDEDLKKITKLGGAKKLLKEFVCTSNMDNSQLKFTEIVLFLGVFLTLHKFNGIVVFFPPDCAPLVKFVTQCFLVGMTIFKLFENNNFYATPPMEKLLRAVCMLTPSSLPPAEIQQNGAENIQLPGGYGNNDPNTSNDPIISNDHLDPKSNFQHGGRPVHLENNDSDRKKLVNWARHYKCSLVECLLFKLIKFIKFIMLITFYTE